jgi:hypothetical protein
MMDWDLKVRDRCGRIFGWSDDDVRWGKALEISGIGGYTHVLFQKNARVCVIPVSQENNSLLIISFTESRDVLHRHSLGIVNNNRSK